MILPPPPPIACQDVTSPFDLLPPPKDVLPHTHMLGYLPLTCYPPPTHYAWFPHPVVDDDGGIEVPWPFWAKSLVIPFAARGLFQLWVSQSFSSEDLNAENQTRIFTLLLLKKAQSSIGVDCGLGWPWPFSNSHTTLAKIDKRPRSSKPRGNKGQVLLRLDSNQNPDQHIQTGHLFWNWIQTAPPLFESRPDQGEKIRFKLQYLLSLGKCWISPPPTHCWNLNLQGHTDTHRGDCTKRSPSSRFVPRAQKGRSREKIMFLQVFLPLPLWFFVTLVNMNNGQFDGW